MKKLIVIALIAAFGAFTTLTVPAADKKPTDKPADKKETPADKKKEETARPVPFRGKIDSVDKTAKTIKVGERVFHVMGNTRLMSKGKAATLDDAKVGEEVGGQYREGEGGKLELVMIRIGPRPEAPAKDEKK